MFHSRKNTIQGTSQIQKCFRCYQGPERDMSLLGRFRVQVPGQHSDRDEWTNCDALVQLKDLAEVCGSNEQRSDSAG
jgi:hypothetical protein